MADRFLQTHAEPPKRGMRMAMTLSELVCGTAVPAGASGLTISGLALDSRTVQPGDLFFAVPGTHSDGLSFARAAVAAGAVAIVADKAPAASFGVPSLVVADVRAALAEAAARFYARQPRTIVAVTGTAGKTSVADFTRQIFEALGHKAASLGTLGIIKPGSAAYGSLTTPDPIALHRSLEALAQEGITHLAMEASSHGIEQKRLDGVRLVAAAFTNLGRDHLDYHADMDAYFAAKLRLFRELLPQGCPAVVNADGAWSERLIADCKAQNRPLFTVGRAGADLRLAGARRDGFRQHLELEFNGRPLEVELGLAGEFQVENALTAAGLVMTTQEKPDAVLAALATLKGVPGRLELAGEARGGLVFVDYSHKPEALANAISALRPFTSGRLVVVFGCGGDRDPGKRPIMGRIAVETADRVIVTDDNPRSEDPAAIRRAVLAGAPGAIEIGDRAEAICAAVHGIGAGDVVLVAGKGHETGQIIGSRTLHFSDHEAVAAAIKEIAA
ncbi:UDP-N-acetylmuramoylalanyl-D-glutamate--2,6-diaminopimelate ligase [Rhizobiales bacterium GAS188]|nr:UDP-N-acetylmuramoylalanyl-D-glutamate--2,6-diaminopimelate ligase [Rhizobiales bacterium GAS188]